MIRSARYVFALDLAGTSAAGEPVTAHFTTAPRLFSGPGDDPASIPYRAIVTTSPRWSVSATTSASLLGESESRLGSWRIAASGLTDPAAFLVSSWATYTMRQAPMMPGHPVGFSTLEQVSSGGVRRVAAVSSTEIEIEFDIGEGLEGPIVDEFYLGLGGGVQLIAASSQYLRDADPIDTTDLVSLSEISIILALRLDAAGAASDFSRLVWRGLLGGDISIHFGYGANSGNDLWAAAGSSSLLVGGDLAVGELSTVAITVAPGELRILAGGIGDAAVVASLDDDAVTYEGKTSAYPLSIGGRTRGLTPTISTDRHSDVSLFAAWVADAALDAGSINDLLAGGDDERVIRRYRFGERTGSDVGDDVGDKDMALFGSPSWISSQEGDDPRDFPGSIAGTRKRRLYGYGRSVELLPIDSGMDLWQGSELELEDLDEVRQGAAALYPDEELLTDALGELVTDTDDTIVATVGSGLTFQRFVEGFADSAVDGQPVELVDAGAASGTYQIKAGSKTPDALGLTLEATGGGAAGLPSLSLPSGSKFRTPAADVQYSFDLASSVVTSAAGRTAPLVMDAMGRRLAGSAAVTALFELFAGVAPDVTRLTVDPECGVLVQGDETLEAVLSELARSAGAAWWYTGGQYYLGTYSVPSESDEIEITLTGKPSLLDPAKLAPAVGRVVELEPIPSETPPPEIRIAYGRTWLPAEDAPAALPPDVRRLLTDEWRLVSRSTSSTGTAADAPIETYLRHRADAVALAERMASFVDGSVEWYNAEIAGVPATELSPLSRLWVQRETPSAPHLGAGRPGILVGTTVEAGNATTKVKLYVLGG